MKRTILKGMVRFYLYRMKISTKIRIFHQNSDYIDENSIYQRNLDYISETADISPKIAIYQRNSDYIDEKQQ
ncbi:hypothetical protein ASG97_18915 [Bacillus sp. Soil745]|nr:hypothetical protein ASG97_18915 [Bacillus sp. Soil745]